MPRIKETTIGDVVSSLPAILPYRDGSTGAQPTFLLITCAGFEDRASAIADAGVGPIQHILIVEYPTNQKDNAESLRRLQKMEAESVETLRYDRRRFLHELLDYCQQVGRVNELEVIVDVSSMASYVTARVLAALWEKLPRARLRLFYAEAKLYHPTEEAWTEFFGTVPDPQDNLSIAERYDETYFQAKGVESTYENEVFPGTNQGPVATEILAIPSFSLQRTKSMTTFAQSHYNVAADGVCWFLGQPPDRRKNGWRFDALAKLYNVTSGGIPLDTRDYRDLIRKFDGLWEKAVENDRHLVVADMGSKMQHVGVFLFIQMYPECGLLHCEPEEFIANRYSEGVGPLWELNLGKISDLTDTLRGRRRLGFEWE